MLNQNQINAVNHVYGPCLLLAGPGSGKTFTLVERIVHMLDVGIPPEQILVITFTKDAAREMKERFIKRVNRPYPVTFGTFHSIFYRMLREHRDYRDQQILRPSLKYQILDETLAHMHLSPLHLSQKEELCKDFSRFQNMGKNKTKEILHSQFYSNEEFFKIFQAFDQRKREYHCLDFDDMLVRTKEVFEQDVAFLQQWQQRFTFFLVDEMQDMNDVQFSVLRMLAKSEHIFGVGDDDQAIYGFRGANPRFMLDFPTYYPSCKILQLTINYRCSQLITQAAASLISHNQTRFSKTITSASSDPGRICVCEFDTTIEMITSLCDLFLKERKETQKMKETAILFRTKSQAYLLQSLLKEKGIPFSAKEPMADLSTHFIVCDLLSYLRLAKTISFGYLQQKDLLRVLNRPNRNLSRACVYKEKMTPKEVLSYYPKATGGYLSFELMLKQLELLSSFSLTSALHFILHVMGYQEWVLSEQEGKNEPMDTHITILELIQDAAGECKTVEELESFFLTKDKMEQEKETKEGEHPEMISLYTYHGSKGLEFERVFVLHVNEGMTPSEKAIDTEALEEERRMFYVAVTRAKSEIFLLAIKKQGGKNMFLSRFLEEMDIDLDAKVELKNRL